MPQPLKVEIDGVRYEPRREIPLKTRFASCMRELREESGLTVEQISEQVNISPPVLREIEMGVATSFWIIARLAKLYGVSLDYLAKTTP